jgi:hypothetical protein
VGRFLISGLIAGGSTVARALKKADRALPSGSGSGIAATCKQATNPFFAGYNQALCPPGG